jgi:hypothetical protein
MLIESGVAHLPEASPTETANDSESTEETG